MKISQDQNKRAVPFSSTNTFSAASHPLSLCIRNKIPGGSTATYFN